MMRLGNAHHLGPLRSNPAIPCQRSQQPKPAMTKMEASGHVDLPWWEPRTEGPPNHWSGSPMGICKIHHKIKVPLGTGHKLRRETCTSHLQTDFSLSSPNSTRPQNPSFTCQAQPIILLFICPQSNLLTISIPGDLVRAASILLNPKTTDSFNS